MKKPFEETSSNFSNYLSDTSSGTASTSGSLGEGSEDSYHSISAAPAIPDMDWEYFRNLPSSLNILTNASDTIRRITDPEKQRDVVKFLLCFQNVLLTNRFTLDRIGNLSPLRISLNEDGSVLIEWIFRDFRIGFSIEEDRTESNWYLVSNQNLNQVDLSGLLSSQDLGELLTSLIAFVLSNT
jgi:hypothetical protein